MVNRNIHLFLIPMPFCTFVLLDFFVLFESSSMPFFLNFYLGSSIHSVLLCERCIDFSTHRRRRTLAILYSYGSVLCFDTYYLLRTFWLSFAFFGFQFLAWDHLYIIYYLPCFLSMGLLLWPPQTFLNVRWMEPRNSITDLFILSYFTRIK